MARTDTRNRARFWRTPAVPGASCLVADFTQHDFAPHRHEALVIAVTEAGGAEFRSGGRTQEAVPSGLLVFNPDEPHSSRMARSLRWRYRSVYLAAPALSVLQQAVGLDATPYFTENVLHDTSLIRAFVHMHQALESEGSQHAEWQRELLVDFFGTLARRHAATPARVSPLPRDGDKVKVVQRIVHERYGENLTLEELGGAVGLTPFQLIALFKRSTGLTPHAYLTQLRLKAALAAMKQGRALADAAVVAGFYDQSALTTHFKRSYGITPLQWVQARRG